ncbi:MAG: SEC-C metal-binding domain-containing protein [Elusimicrobiales bacterium]
MLLNVFKKIFKQEPVPQTEAKTAPPAAPPAQQPPAKQEQKPEQPQPEKPKTPETDDLRKLSDADIDAKLNEELGGLPKNILGYMKNPEIRAKITELAKKMIKAGVDIRSERQIKNWIKSHPDEVRPQQAGQPEAQKPEPFRRQAPKVNRNDACPCGSGKKYKKCCGAGETA